MSVTEREMVTGGEDLAVSLGITYRQLDYWVWQGYLRPADPTPGTGVPREWPEAELEIARRMGRLTTAGLTPAAAAVIARDTWPAGELAPGITITVTEETS